MLKCLYSMILMLGLALVTSAGVSSDVKKNTQVVEVVDQNSDFDASVAIDLVSSEMNQDAEANEGIIIPDGEYITVSVETALRAHKSRFRCDSYVPPELKRETFI
jgi:hypothetical protein